MIAAAAFVAGAVAAALSGVTAPDVVPPPAAVALPGISLSPDGLRTVATPVPPAAPPAAPGAVAEVEPNDNLAAAARAALGISVQGALTAGDLDYFAVDLPAGTEVVATVVVTRGDASLALFDGAGEAVATAATRSGIGLRAATVAGAAGQPRSHVSLVATAPEGASYRLTVDTRR
jgi:hypothetical protein